MPERVLVTGAAGHVGRAVLALLAERGVPVTALVLDPPGELPAARVVIGDARDPAVVAAAMEGVDAVVHLAALPSPRLGTPEEVFTTNTRATFVVLEEAGRRGVRHAAVAGSYAVGGLPFAVRPVSPPYLPVDTATPLRITDPYALSKQVDEATSAMMAARHAMTVVALRLPYVGDAEHKLPAMAEQYARRPEAGARDMWSYIDTRDAARALVMALDVARPGAHTVYAAAPETLSPLPTERLLEEFHPDVPRRRRFPGRTVPIDLEPAAALLGFTARHVYPVRESGW
ncbi:nucleoside-diphosphate-sugar epimerase [Thermocatellispora tengchongensis]|uniref:Nucleoside-diphosphate-sugar epimerase n=1 Tax=Thermocatellispora tengchongensis TaxID=1073253 RepID=A0A840PSK1_9ACTN|nr:NAD(P)-dependent oxidoreductase [Thermocatellispora tengchongensis]MBB5138925.1 nucleoside-diphosphate-sugar epimerase [Thermocatellispora tengchongensis]